MLKSKKTTIVLVIICLVMAAILILAPLLSKTQTVFDTNDREIGKETVEWIEDYSSAKNQTQDDGKAIVKGEYSASGNVIRLEKQETIDADNYGSGYDLMYIDGALTDFTISANIMIEDTDFNGYSKAGFKIAVNEEKYFSAFILPSTGEFCLLSTLDAGMNWIQIWPCISIPGFDLNKPTELKLVKTGELIEVYANGELKHTETEFKIGADTPVKVGLTSEAVGPVEYGDLSVVSADGIDLLNGKGEYTISGNTIRLDRQETQDGDNYAAGYDLFYFDGSLTNFTVKTEVTFEDTELNASSKAGLKIAVDESKYFDAFILPSTGQLTLLSTLDGGAGWVQIWNCIDIPGFDAAAATSLAIVKIGETIEVYANETLLHTEKGFAIGTDTAVKVGVTSEAVGPVVYNSIAVEAADPAASGNTEDDESSGTETVTAEGTVKGVYSVDGSTVKLEDKQTIDGDNYAAGYDLYYFEGAYGNFSVSSDITIEDTTLNASSKAGIKIAVDESSYFDAFILPTVGQVTLLSTLDGGANWVQIWNCIDIPGFDVDAATNLRLVRNGENIEVYVNGELLHTETGFVIGADTKVKVGLTSEAVSPVVYANVEIEEN